MNPKLDEWWFGMIWDDFWDDLGWFGVNSPPQRYGNFFAGLVIKFCPFQVMKFNQSIRDRPFRKPRWDGWRSPTYNLEGFSGHGESPSQQLGGGFKYVLFSPLFGEDSHFDEFFQMGWNHQLERRSPVELASEMISYIGWPPTGGLVISYDLDVV